MAKEIINPFTDIPDSPLNPNDVWGSQIFDNLKSLQYGAGATSFKVDDSGLWLGAEKWANAPFRVNMQGQVWATDVTLSQYVPVAGAAADINTNPTTVSGAKLTAGTITADKLNVSSLSAITADLGTVTAGSLNGVNITIGSGNNVFKASSQGIWLGNSSFASAPFYVNMSGNLYANNVFVSGQIINGAGSTWGGNTIDGSTYVRNINANYITAGAINASIIAVTNLNASNIITGTLNAAVVNVINLNASSITAGNLNIGGAGQINLINLVQSSGSGDAKLKWSGGAAIWADGSNYMGFYAPGERFYFYTGGTTYALFQRGSPAQFYAGIDVSGGLYASDNIRAGSKLIAGSQDLELGGKHLYLFQNATFYNTCEFWNDGQVRIKISGTTKTAVVPTSKGYRSLYSMESPEVWFMDFCFGRRKNPFWMFWDNDYQYNIDPMFREVAVPPYQFMPTMRSDIFQVWGRRAGHNHKRFEKKTKQEYLANEKFLGMAKNKNYRYN